jgi:hypothetical protein
MTMDARSWLVGFAHRIGLDPPTDEEVAQILALAGVAAHSSERTAAPVACWLAGRAGLDLSRALEAAEAV